MNTPPGDEHLLPSRVAERYQNSRIVVFSSGNLYPKVGVHSGGATEETRTEPVGEYCMSCQGRERMFEYAAKTYGTRVAVYRLNYAVDLRYGVLYDMAHNILEGKPSASPRPASTASGRGTPTRRRCVCWGMPRRRCSR